MILVRLYMFLHVKKTDLKKFQIVREKSNFGRFLTVWTHSAGRVGSGRFVVLNDSASPKMIMKIYFNFFRLFL